MAGFIQLDDIRIKLSNIKDYGLSSRKFYFQKVYDVVDTTTPIAKYLNIADGVLSAIRQMIEPGRATQGNSWGSVDYIYNNNDVEINENVVENLLNNRRRMLIFPLSRTNENADYFIDGKKVIYSNNKFAEKDDLIIDDVKYLFVTTYQNDNYTFFENEAKFNISEKCDELDRLLN